MPMKTAGATITVALLGNPNTGKSTLFSALVGVPQRVGNYPGVTVEKKVGHTQYAGRQLTVIDLPGTYSLAPRSLDEMVAVDVLLGRRSDVPPPDVIVCIVDASNLQRNLYLVSQALELGRPLLIVLNKMDIASERHVTIDVAELRDRLGVPVIEMQAHRRLGLEQLKQALAAADSLEPPSRCQFASRRFLSGSRAAEAIVGSAISSRCAAVSRGADLARYQRVPGACGPGRW